MSIIKKANYLYRTEGIMPLIKKGFAFFLKFVYQSRWYYIIEHTPQNLKEIDFLPDLHGFSFRLIENKDISADEPQSKYLYEQVPDAYERLDAGAAAFCVFLGDSLVSLGWVAFTEKAHKSLFQPPYKVDFNKGQASTGGGWTSPQYRGRGLAKYVYYKRLEYIWNEGKNLSRAAVITGNIASLKMHANFSQTIIAKGRELKVLWKKSWREIPVRLDIREVIK
jgi:hypothetical protein